MLFSNACRWYFCLFFLITSCLYADWNEIFDAESRTLLQEFPNIPRAKYLKHYRSFVKTRKKLLRDKVLRNKVATTAEDKKFLLRKKKDGLIIKKRGDNNIRELFAWELSFALGVSEIFVPSFPIEIEGKKVIVQRLEPLKHKSGAVAVPSKRLLRKVSLETYWKTLLGAYLLGHADLKGKNIGISKEGAMRLYDNESCFDYQNEPLLNDISFDLQFVSQAFDWPHYRKRLDQKTARILQKFVRIASSFEARIKAYAAYRPLSFSEQGLLFRLEKLRNFPLKKGVSFRDFFGSLHPRMNPGLDKLNQIVGKILKKRVDHGSSLFLVARWMRLHTILPEDQAAIQRWIDTYIKP